MASGSTCVFVQEPTIKEFRTETEWENNRTYAPVTQALLSCPPQLWLRI